MTAIPLLPGTTDDTVQWRAASLQMVNWGGFHGPHRVDFAPGATLISGASGTGKSTLLDAYIALMMSSSVPFNGASNDATTGRARSADQRNILSYLRGKRDSSHDGDTLTDQVMRGDGEPTWGALAMTFVDETGRRFTAIRTYFVPAACTRSADVATRWFTRADDFDLKQLEPFVTARFDPRALAAEFDGLKPHDSVTRFLHHVSTRLGIGAGGNGGSALRLLARIQAGHQVKSVDGLYKELVLEPPGTYAAADNAVKQFRALDQSYDELETDGQKQKRLERITALHDEYEAALARAARLDRFGVTQAGSDTGFGWWEARTEYALLQAVEQRNKLDRETTEADHRAASQTVTRLESELADIERELRERGGDLLERLAARITERTTALHAVERHRSWFKEQTKALRLDPTDANTFHDLQTAAAAFLATAEQTGDTLRAGRDKLVAERPTILAQLAPLVEEHASLQHRDSLIPAPFDRARNRIAAACGLSPADLPFAAELVDVHPDHDRWRLAAELTLGGFGLTMLMDERDQQRIRETIEQIPDLQPRVRFEGVALGQHAPTPADPNHLSGRLVFKEASPFVGWVKRQVTARHLDHRCVDHASQLGGDEPKVTITGQTSRGRRGAHGRNADERFILGFSNQERRQELADAITGLQTRLRELDAEISRLHTDAQTLQQRADAYRIVTSTDWASLDRDTVAADLARLQQEHATLLRDSSDLSELERRRETTRTSVDAARNDQYRLAAKRDDLVAAWGRLTDRQDELTGRLDRFEQQGLALPEEDAQHLDELLATQTGGAVDHAGFPAAAGELRRTLAAESKAARSTAEARAESLGTIFTSYNDRWKHPDRGNTVAAYPEFKAIYDDIIKHGLFERRAAFKRKLQRWSGDDLKLLNDAFDQALRDIEDRLEPVNEILRDVPFGANQDRLRIVLRQLHPHEQVQFRRRLKMLASNTAADWTEEQTEDRFRRLREFMRLLEKPELGSSRERDNLLDVRRHIEITARRVGLDGAELSTYASLGGKSGGESQELVAFIVGAALRYQLGDETRTKPRFAPVLLDEGFVKADGEFAKRAVDAWRELGFQLIIGAPLDKVTALEPHMQLNLAVTKNQTTGRSYVRPFRDPRVGS